MTKLVVFESAVDVRTELNLLTSGIKQFFPEEELKHVRDLQKFVLKKEDGFVHFVFFSFAAQVNIHHFSAELDYYLGEKVYQRLPSLKVDVMMVF
jgi:hypothetical protein